MPGEVDVMQAENDGKVSMEGAENIKGANEDSETSKDSSSEETESQETSSKDEKTVTEDESSKETPEDEVKDDGNPVPYPRFKQVNDSKKEYKDKLEKLEADNEGIAELLKNPSVYRAVLQSKGVTDPNIVNEKMKEAGFEVKDETPEGELFKKLTKGENLSTQEGWFKVFKNMHDHYSKESLAPLEKKLTDREKSEWISKQEGEAKKLAKDTYGIDYGTPGKDERNINTAIGKMTAYLDKHPEDAKLGHTKLLRLALSEEGIKLGEEKGLSKEKDRQTRLKNSAMEGDAQVIRDGSPTSDWSTSEILAWRRKHGK